MTHEYSVELRIYGKNLNSSEVTSDLGINPSLIFRKGERIGKNKRIKEELWAYNGRKGNREYYYRSLEEGLMYLLSTLRPIKEKVLEYKSKHNVVLWCGHFHTGMGGGPKLSSNLLQELSEFGIDICIESYYGIESKGRNRAK